MKRKGKRMAAMFLAIGLLLSDIPVTAWAVSPEYLTETEAATPGTEAATPGTEAATPETEATTPETEAATPETEATTAPATESAPATETVSEGDIVEEPAKEITPVRAENTLTALYITENAESGAISVDVTKDAEGTGWHYEAAAGTLTLEGYNGGSIKSVGNLTLLLSQHNRITVNGGVYYGISVEGKLLINKTDSDTGDTLTISTGADTTGYSGSLVSSNNTVMEGGTLNLSMLGADMSYIAVIGDFTLRGAANLKSELAGDFNDNDTLYLESSGTTDILAVEGDSRYNMAVSELAVRGSGPVSIETVNTKKKRAAIGFLREYTGTSKLTVKGGPVGLASDYNRAKTREDMCVTSLTDNRYIARSSTFETARRKWICDPEGNMVTELTIEAKETPFTITDTPLLDLPAMKVGTNYSYEVSVYDCLHGFEGTSKGYSPTVSFELKEGSSLPKGLKLNSEIGGIYGTPTAECPAGKVVVVATKKNTGETAEVEIAYGAVTEKDKFLTVGGESYNIRLDASGTGWSYRAEEATLTLTGYNGGSISCEKGLNVILSGDNRITVNGGVYYGISVEGKLLINKTDSDTGDTLTISTGADTTGYSGSLVSSNNTVMEGGTLNLSMLGADMSYIAVIGDFTLRGAANLKSELAGDFNDNDTLYLESSGTTDILAVEGDSRYNMAVSELAVRGSGPVSIETVNTKKKRAAIGFLREYTGTSKLTVKGGPVGLASDYNRAKTREDMCVTSLTDNRYIARSSTFETARRKWICDPEGNMVTELTIEAKETPFTITDTPLLDLPAMKVGTNYSYEVSVYDCLHGFEGTSKGYSPTVSFELKEGSSLPKGLKLNSEIGGIYGTPTAECPAGKVVVVATKKSTGETAEVEIAYGAVTVAYPVTGVSLNTDSLLLAEGESAGLTATVEPAEASISEVSFKSSDSSIASISATGNTAVVTAGKPGTARITVTTKQGGMTAYCDVTVKAAVPAVSFDVEKNRITGFVAEKTYEITDKDSGEVLQPSFSGRTLVEVPAAWFGKTVCIKEKGADGGDSDAMELVIAHAFAGTYSADDKNHWKECACGEKTEQAPHTYAWKVDTEPTDSSDGEKHRYCTVCGYEEETKVSIPRYLRESLVFTGITAPTEGAEPDYSVGEAGEDCVEITKVAWLSEGNPMVSGAVFEKEKEYCLTVDFTMKGSYHLPADIAGVATELQDVDAGAVTDKKLSGDAATGYRLTVTFLRAGEAVELTEETISISGLAESYEYTGEALTPEFLVSYVSGTEQRALVRDKHYTVSYEENTQPGYAKVIIRGKGFYKGTVEARFLIYRQVSDLTLCEAAYTYTGKEILPETEIRDRGILLTAGEDYKVESITDNLMPGYMKITVTGGSNGKYRGSHTFTESIRIKGLPIEGAEVTGLKNAVFTGKEITPRFTVKLSGKVLKEGTDFEAVFVDNLHAGEARVIINGRGIYEGSVKKTFTITRKSFAGVKIAALGTQTYTGSPIKPALTVTDGESLLTEGVDYVVTGYNNTQPGKAGLTVTACGDYTGVKNISFDIRYSLSRISVTGVPTGTVYTGKAVTPEAVLTDASGYVLQKNKDYTVSYRNNRDAGEAEILVKGKGVYTGSLLLTFRIEPVSLDTALVSGCKDTVYTGKPAVVKPVVKLGKTTLKAGKDYTVSVENAVEAGAAVCVITGTGNYKGEVRVNFTVKPQSLKSCRIDNLGTCPFDGTPVRPDVRVTCGKKVLNRYTDYTVAYENNTATGKGKVVVTGTGNYEGSIEKTFLIRDSILTADISGVETAVTYTGKAVTFPVTVTRAGTVLKAGKDYSITYKKNKDAGEASLVITGKGSYTGEIVKNFTIKKAELGAGGAIGDIKTFTYTGKAICPSVTVTYGKTRLTAKDYRVYYTRNTEAGTARVTVTGTGNYTGTLAGEFTIAAKEIRKCSIRVSDAPLLTATGGIPEITVKDGGTVLLQGRDYTVSYQDNHSLGKATAIITGCGSYGGETVKTYQVKKDFTAAKLAWDLPDDYYNGKEKKPKISVTLDGVPLKEGKDYTLSYVNCKNASVSESAQVIASGKGEYAGSLSISFTIRPLSLNSGSVTVSSIRDVVYNGKSQEPSFTVKYGKTVLKKDVDYTVSYYWNVDAGTASVTIRGKGNYEGSVYTDFRITPKKLTAKIAAIPDVNYTPEGAAPALTLTDKDKILQEGRDYTVSYTRNREVGTATAVVTGCGNYSGTLKKTFRIKPMDLSGVNINNIASESYTGSAVRPEPVVYVNTASGRVYLKENVDYVYAYENNVEPGTATVTITGCGNYTGSRKKTFRITE